MPISIDLDHITGPFRSIGRFQLTPIAYIFQRLGKWLDDRVKKADDLEESSRGYPVVWIDGDAVQCWLHEIQRGALSPNGSPPGFWEQMRAASDAFWTGLQRIPEAIANENIVPQFLARVEAAVKAILDSIIRFENPTAALFDPRLRTAGDLFGEAALAFRALNSSKGQVLRFLFGQVAPAYMGLAAGGAQQKTALNPRSTIDLLEWVSRWVLSGLLIVPYLPELISKLWESASLTIKSKTIDALAAREERVFGLRRTIIDLFYVRLRDLLQTAISFTWATGTVLIAQVRFWTGFVHLYGLRLLLDVGKIADDLADYLYKVVALITKIFTKLDVLKFDLSPYMMLLLGGLPLWLLSKIKRPPQFLLIDFIHANVRSALLGWIGETLLLLSLAGPFTWPIQDRLIALGRVVNAVFSPLGPPLRETAWPSAPPPFPSIFDQWAKAAHASDIQRKFEDLAKDAPVELGKILGSAAEAIDSAGDQFEALVAGAARGEPVQQYLRISDRAAEIARQAFGPEAEQLRNEVARDQLDVVARSFESWFAAGGFQVLEQFLERYVGGMLFHFREREETGDELLEHLTKTSPQILAKRATLGRATMQRLTIDARGRVLDSALAQEIAEKFRGAISDAYLTGQRQIAKLATVAAV